MTNNDELAMKLKEKASLALEAWNKFISLPDDVDLERGLSLYEMSLLSSHDSVSNPANILALLAERDADKIQIAELESKLSQNESWSLAAQKYIAYLESQAKQLVLESDADKKRIADLQRQREEETQRANRANFEGYSRAMRELEARTVSVKLPVVPSQYETLKLCLEPSDGYGMQKGAEYMRDEFIKALAAAGIKLEVGE